MEHPSAKVLVELAELQDEEVGDGTTSVVSVLIGQSLVSLTLSTLSNYIGLFHSLFWAILKRSLVVKGLTKDIMLRIIHYQ